MSSTCLLWMRRDLRLHDHPALHRARAEFDVVIPVFVLDDGLLHGRYASSPRERFLAGCLHALDEQLRERGSGLVVRRGAPAAELRALLSAVAVYASGGIKALSDHAAAKGGAAAKLIGQMR
ncbi:MAG: deoxyribodipyrimidine photo-lyase [Baekduiaceae bacterium]